MFAINVQSLFKKSAFVLCVLFVLAGCITLPPVTADKNLLSFLVDGISRETVLMKLGEPSASFEQGRILTYRVGADAEKGYFLLDRQANIGWENTKYSLVLVFNEKGLLIKHTLVQIR